MPRCSGASARFFSATSGLVLTATFGRIAELFDFADGASKVDRKQMEETSNLACSYTNRLSFVSRLARMFAHLETSCISSTLQRRTEGAPSAPRTMLLSWRTR